MQGSNQLEFQNILKFYQDRNYTTVYENYNPVWRVSMHVLERWGCEGEPAKSAPDADRGGAVWIVSC